MPESMSFKELDGYLDGNIVQVNAAIKELEEIQTEFVSAYQESKEVHDSTLTDLSDRAVVDLAALPSEIRQAIEERVLVEQKMLDERRQELREVRVPEATQIADDLLSKAQKAAAEKHELNPVLDREEEQLKVDRAEMENQLDKINQTIRQKSGLLKSLFNFTKLIDLDRQRQKLLGRMEENASSLRRVREEWAEFEADYLEKNERIRESWQSANLDAAHMREELAQLDDDEKRDRLIWQRAAFHVLDNWKEPLPETNAPYVEEINQMVLYNIRTDDFKEGLGKAAGLIALLNGIRQGLENVQQSVRALMKEQLMHSEYLKLVDVRVDGTVLDFNQRWPDLRKKVHDESKLGENPAEFVALFDDEYNDWLTEENITHMFEELGNGLTMATAGWKG